MSVNSTPKGYSQQNIPSISPLQYFSAEKLESSIPCLVIKRISDIIEEYFKLKPELTNKENQIKGLFAYNQKMMETIEKFMHHEKKVVKKYNKLCQIYAKNFKEYWNAKNVDVNFKDLINPITSVSENFSMNEWKVEVEPSPAFVIPRKYEDMLLKVIEKHYLNRDHLLESMLERQLDHLEKYNSSEPESLPHIRQLIKELNNTTPTTANMFDLLEKRKNIENLIKEIDQKYYGEIITKDLNFIDEVARIHSIALSPTADKMRTYLDYEAQIRRGLKKKSRKYRESLQLQFERLDSENTDLKEELESEKKRYNELEIQKNSYQHRLSYIQIKQKAGQKKERNSSNTSIIEDPLNLGMKETSKKMESKIAELENQIFQLRKAVSDMEEEKKHLNVKRELMQSNSQMEELRLKLCSKLMELGIQDTETMTSGEMFDKIMQRQLGVKHYEFRDPTGRQSAQCINIKITESLPIGESNKSLHDLPKPHVTESIIEKVEEEANKEEYDVFKRKDVVIESGSKEGMRETESNEIKATNFEIKDPPVYAPMTQSEPLKRVQFIIKQEGSVLRKKNFSSPLSSEVLLSISERKSVEEQSKMHDVSRVFKDNKSAIDDKNVVKSEENSKDVDYYLVTIKALEEKNQILIVEISSLKREIQRLEELLFERKARTPSVFQSIEKQLKNTGKDHAIQIEGVCQSIVREMQKLEGSQFTRMVANMEEVIKNFKSSCSEPKLPNINQIPVLSKHITEPEDNLFRSENLMAQLFLGKKEQNKGRYSIAIEDKSGRLSIHSGEVKLHIKQQKSIYFGIKDPQQPQSSESYGYSPKIIEEKPKGNSAEKIDNSIEVDEDEIVDMVNEFEGRSKRWKDPNISENSLKLSQSNFRMSRQNEIKSSIKLIDKIDRKIIQDAEFLYKMEQKLEEIKNESESGQDLYWFYKRYRQAIEALESTEAKLNELQRKRDACMDQMDGDASKHKLEENNFFLQEKCKDLEEQLRVNKLEYENNMTEHIKGIDDIKENAIEQLVKAIFGQKSNPS